MPDPDSSIVTTTRATGRLAAVLVGVVAPTTLLVALAYYFGWRREEAFAGYFGIDPALLELSTDEYVLRSVDALFAPVVVLLLVAFCALAIHALLADRIESDYTAPVVFLVGLAALAVGLALAVGHPVSSRVIYVQALGLGVGAALIMYALAHWPGLQTATSSLAATSFVAAGVVIVSLFWATAEYADDRGLQTARRLARNIDVSPQALVYSKVDLGIDPLGMGSGAAGTCAAIQTTQTKKSAYRYRYAGFRLLAHSAGKYFVTPTHGNGEPWDPAVAAVFVLPDDNTIRIELLRGTAYSEESRESTFAGSQRTAFTC
jgi:hypothetical protein